MYSAVSTQSTWDGHILTEPQSAPHKHMPPKKGGKSDPKKGAKPKSNKSGAGAKAKKKKWSKGKVREKLANAVIWDDAMKDKLYSEVPKYKVITVAILSDRLKINGSLAREALRELEGEGMIRRVADDCKIYTRIIKEKA
eukprot:NODE_857_length_576_cov_604.944321_g847_i0.p1 GENE.NODE_857_length_576_cov_604.944321_g847_i0~~NODE_857_length_576_cov_604.944321_g847_i0.p1  ORF type:complete len:140 (+),score=39.87 NODE_857_length_576_cov_604.944321_g847_i0:1-420(+)